jgi:hypothetical protein
MEGPDLVDVPETPAGESAEISVELVAPTEMGRYRGNWQMCVNETECFGEKIYVQIVSSPPPPTATPDTAGVTRWLAYGGEQVGVQEIAWSYSLGYWRPESGKVFLSLYIIAMNVGDSETTFNPLDFALVDGGGEISGQLIFGSREPEFSLCTVKAGGVCEGWWTTSIWDRPDVRGNLTFRWRPSFWDSPLETQIEQ